MGHFQPPADMQLVICDQDREVERQQPRSLQGECLLAELNYS